MVKAVDGGGGRGIRLIRDEQSLPSAVKLAVAESPSKQLFAEKAAIDGFRHIEVQIIGDGNGDATHLWERECSIQRRYQKVIELAPSVVSDRRLIAKVIEDALRMAKHVRIQEPSRCLSLTDKTRSVTSPLEPSSSWSTQHHKNTSSSK
jgi:biotin carboxylase